MVSIAGAGKGSPTALPAGLLRLDRAEDSSNLRLSELPQMSKSTLHINRKFTNSSMAEHLQSNVSQDLVWEICRMSSRGLSVASTTLLIGMQVETIRIW